MEPTAGIEPATPCLQGRCYYQLSYVGKKVFGIHGWNRTNNLRFWRPSLCQLSYAYRKNGARWETRTPRKCAFEVHASASSATRARVHFGCVFTRPRHLGHACTSLHLGDQSEHIPPDPRMRLAPGVMQRHTRNGMATRSSHPSRLQGATNPVVDQASCGSFLRGNPRWAR